jgi:hypothetical protein
MGILHSGGCSFRQLLRSGSIRRGTAREATMRFHPGARHSRPAALPKDASYEIQVQRKTPAESHTAASGGQLR